MPPKGKGHKHQAAARARAGRQAKRDEKGTKGSRADEDHRKVITIDGSDDETSSLGNQAGGSGGLVGSGGPEGFQAEIIEISEDESECGYDGGVNHWVEEDGEGLQTDDDDGDAYELLEEVLQEIDEAGGYWNMGGELTQSERGLPGNTGHSGRTKRHHEEAARDRHAEREAAKVSNDPRILLMMSMFGAKPSIAHPPANPEPEHEIVGTPVHDLQVPYFGDLVQYDSDIESDTDEEAANLVHSKGGRDRPGIAPAERSEGSGTGRVQQKLLPAVPPLKRRKLDIPVRKEAEMKQKAELERLERGLKEISKLILSKKAKFVGGPNGLQATRAHAIRSFLTMMVKNGQSWLEGSEMAAETTGFAAKWGGRNVRRWTRTWLKERELPESEQG
ncbi:hypothetical protein BKA70DRAFT_1499841 [Coprinopsis sp. MPI-PUGE-AT-0042]|nr:hypothetical protein BKA70DRAFT_1499841 [Coprinopsis sp. MPI-PUGE-AT-0042]